MSNWFSPRHFALSPSQWLSLSQLLKTGMACPLTATQYRHKVPIKLARRKTWKEGEQQDLRAAELLTAWTSCAMVLASSSCRGGVGEKNGGYRGPTWDARAAACFLLPLLLAGRSVPLVTSTKKYVSEYLNFIKCVISNTDGLLC